MPSNGNSRGHPPNSYEFHSQQALLVRQFVENEPFLARIAFLCYTLYSSIPKDRIVEKFELPYPRVISTSTYKYYRVVVELRNIYVCCATAYADLYLPGFI